MIFLLKEKCSINSYSVWEQPQNIRIGISPPEETQKKIPPMKQRRTGLLTVMNEKPAGEYSYYSFTHFL